MVHVVVGPELPELHQAHYCLDDNGRQGRLGRVLQKLREKQQGRAHRQRRDEGCELAPGPAARVHRCAAEGPSDWVAAEERTHQVARAQGKQFLVALHGLASPAFVHGLCDRHGLPAIIVVTDARRTIIGPIFVSNENFFCI